MFTPNEMHTIRDIIDRQAESQPNRAYLISPDTKAEVTFGGLRDNLRLLAGRLQRLGLKSDDKVAFLMDNGLFTAQLFLAATYGGFVAVPLNVRAGVTQLSYTLEHSDARVVFVEEKYASLIKDVLAGVRHEVLVIPAGVDETIEAAGDSPALLPASAPSDAVLLMYTSGSTGLPKAGMHSHRTLLAQAQNLIESHKFTSGDRSLLVLPLYHLNAESVTLIPMLVVGGSVIVPHHFVVSKFWDWIEEYQCTWSALVPTIISQLIDYKDPKAGQRAEAFARIRFLRSSSAPLSPALHREFIDKFKLPLIQAMGSTEGGNVFSNPVPPGVNKIGSPGLPTGFEVRIVNREGADLPANEPGEILLRGPAMMEGYYKDPVTTSASLDAEGWFHTGDLAYRDDDGYFFVVGRSKELIIKGGMNIAPKQIDEVMESHPAVLEAAAVGVPDRYVGEDVVAFVVLRQGMSCDEREMLAFCEERLGHFKTPTRIHFVEDLPKGPSGKVQRLRLVEEAAKPALARSASLGKTPASTNGAAAQNGHSVGLAELKETIVKIWSELLPLAKVTPGSNFFELGGHSLLAIQSLSKLRQKVPVVLSLTEFFENATPQHLAEFALKRMADAPSAEESAPPEELAPIPLRDRASSCPLSPAQRRIWFAEKFMPEALTYNEADGFRLAGPLDLDALERAFNVVISRHELMRSTIEIDGSEASFKVHEKWPLKIKRIDLSRLPAAERKAEADRLLVTEPRLPYDLEKAPGLRVTVAKLGPEEHVLILMMHHIICDWSSEGVLWREISALYRAFLKKEEINLAPLPIQHGDYAAWQEKEFDPANFAEDLAFWKKNLEGAPELLELPADRPRPATATYRGARLRYYLSAALTDGLRQLSRKEKTSHFTLFAAALDVLLHRYTKSDDIVLGIPLADRDRPELQSMIGFMLHTQVLRTRLEPAMRFSDLVGRVQKSALDMFSHRAAPFDLVVRAAGQERSLSHSPLFQMMLIWRDRDQELGFIGLEGLKIESIQAEARTSKFDLTLMVTDGGEEIWFELEYSTDLFDESRMQRMLGHYQRLLEAIVAEPDRSVAELALLTEAERKQILVDWNETSLSVPHDKLLSDLVEDQARRVPDSVAVVFGGRQLTYRELNERANQLAHHLQKLGVGPDSLVAVCVERSLDMVVGLLGVLKAGGAYVPLDPRYPKDRLAFVLEDADAKVLLTQSSLISSMPAAQAKMVQLDADWPTIAQESTAKPKTSTHPENLAYVIYTSGSTGLPKGVEIPHRAAVNFMVSMQQKPGLKEADVLLAVTTISFDIAGLELFLPLVTGAKVVVASRDEAADGYILAQQLQAHKATVLQATPATWRMLLETKWAGDGKLKMLCGGEAMPRDLADELLAKGGELWNMYGPTETTIWSSCSLVERGDAPITIGRPIANTQLYILDPQLQPVPIGVPGELHIGGKGLARGYHRRDELTAQKFIPDPFNKDGRLYKTGDLARFLPDGRIDCLGRLDHQVKIRGFRVELGEIEQVINQQPQVQASAVIVREDTPGDKRLTAYLVSQGTVNSTELREALRAKLPEYMVPAAFVLLPRLPQTPNGKLDRKALPKPGVERAETSASYVAPGTPAEKAIAEIWAKALGLLRVGINDNFFELGGHSLLLMKIQSQVSEKLETRVSIVELFQYPTVGALARHLSQPAAPSHRLQQVQARTDKRKEALERQRKVRATR